MTHQRRAVRRALLCTVGTAVALSLVAPIHGRQADRRALEQRAQERLRALRAEAQALLAQERTLIGELRRFEIERSLKVEELGQLEADAARVEEELQETTRHLTLLQKAHDEQTPALRARLREVYKLGSGGYVRLLLGLDHPRDLGRALRTVSAMAAQDRERVRAHRTTISALDEARRALEKRRGELATLRRSTSEARAALDRAVRERSALVASIDSRRDLNAQLTGELQAAQTKLQRTLTGLEDASAVALPLRTLQGTLDWPAPGEVVTRFGRSRASRFGTVVVRRGIEIAAAAGAPVRAVHGGTVAHAAPFSGFGNLVIVDHGNRAFSVYGFLDEVRVARGARVEPGHIVGSVGLDPAGQAALHFELRVDGEPVDPLQWLKAAR
jgi:septal ring factor EnvC (AmiA/AmiB activator)